MSDQTALARRYRLRDDAPDGLAYTFDFPAAGLIRISGPREYVAVLTVEEFLGRYMDPVS